MEMRTKLRMLRTDRRGEFTSNEFTKYCKENGIARQLTAPYSPQQNGVVERRNRTVLSTTRSMMKAMKLPLNFWAEAVRHAIYILNRVPTRALLEDRSIPMIYLGIEEGSKAYRLYDPKGNRKHVSRDVKFMETKLWDWDNNREETNNHQEQEPITAPNSPITPQTYTYNPNSEEEDATICSLKNSENGFDDTLVRGFKDLIEIYKNARMVETESLLFTEEEPRNYKEASTDKKWIEAMEAELDSIKKNNTWTLTTLPTNHKAIGLKWVFKTKRDAKGEIIKYKARLVAKGYVQEQGIDFDEVFAPVARIETVRLILALVAYHEWQVHHLDVKSAFLHGEMKEEVYVTQPEVTQKGGEITIKQTGYTNKILKDASMMESNDTKIPMDPGTKLVKAEDGNSVDATYYRSLIGCLRYLLHTRPDLSYSVGLLSRFMQEPKDHHLKAIKQVIRYIKGTKEHGIIYKKDGGCKITGYSDSSYGINTDQGKGTTGIVFYFMT
ncbi:zinc finger, CCHC-type containing protein [Tanacetum coccineum]